ncbi:MAG: tetratricopeptide repeat protein [Pirellulaceae bacterium]|nr:tetratricopeptide repeat protein [Pirellulaceae bacterium]
MNDHRKRVRQRTGDKMKVLVSTESTGLSSAGKRWPNLRALVFKWRQNLASKLYGRATYQRPAAAISLAVTVGILLVVGGYSAHVWWTQDPPDLMSAQQLLLAKHLANEDYLAADAVLEQLVALAPKNADYRFEQATIKAALNQPAVAHRLMRSLASEHPQAALWILEHDFDLNNTTSWSNTEQQRFGILLDLAIKSDTKPHWLRAHNLMAGYHIKLGNIDLALDALERIAIHEPAADLHAASLSLKMGDTDRAKKYAKRAHVTFSQYTADHPQNDASRLNLARALSLMHRDQEAIDVLSAGFELTKQPKFQQAAGEILVTWSERLANPSKKEQTFLPRLQLIHRASQCAPQDPVVLAAILRLVQECERTIGTYKSQMRSALVQGADRESTHFFLGLMTLLDGQIDDARLHLDLATASGSHLSTLLNNLALVMCQSTEWDLDQALALATAATTMLPDQPHFKETRGRILIGLRRYAEAIPELEHGLAATELQAIIYPQLVVAHRQTGNEASAQAIEQRLKREATSESVLQTSSLVPEHR